MTGERLFRIGVFLLPSSALLGGLCLLAASFRGSQGRAQPIWWDRSCQPLLLAAVLMMIGALQAQTGALAWAGLGMHSHTQPKHLLQLLLYLFPSKLDRL